MTKKIIVLLFFLAIPNLFSQVTFIVENLQDNNTKNTSIYISGDFEGWTGGQEKYKLSQNNNHYSITLPKQEGSINFKFTQGSWETVETGIQDNRKYTFGNKTETVKIKISNWEDNTLKESTATKNVSILSEDFYIPQLDKKRRIWVYLPPNYDTSNKSYPVMYMHDGQNLFDNNTSYAGEWEVDETLNKLYQDKRFELIVIGIDNAGEKRMDEYSPWKHKEYGGGEGDAYIDFVVKTLKPYVDNNYRTKSNQENTAIMGSSMGGLISFYATLQYPKVFGKSVVYSPSFWFSDQSFDLAKNHRNLKNTKMYLLAGGKEGANNIAFNEISQTVMDMNKMVAILKEGGFSSDNIRTKVVPDGQHNEALWRDNFEEAILWLFSE